MSISPGYTSAWHCILGAETTFYIHNPVSKNYTMNDLKCTSQVLSKNDVEVIHQLCACTKAKAVVFQAYTACDIGKGSSDSIMLLICCHWQCVSTSPKHTLHCHLWQTCSWRLLYSVCKPTYTQNIFFFLLQKNITLRLFHVNIITTNSFITCNRCCT